MKIEFDNGKMIVTHSSGHVDTYKKSDIDLWLDSCKANLSELQATILNIQDIIASINESKSGIVTSN